MNPYYPKNKSGHISGLKTGVPARRRARPNVVQITRFCIVALFFIAGAVSAHSPQDVQLSYHEMTGNLSVSITHVVDAPLAHHIKEVIIKKNGVVIRTEYYDTQPSASLPFTYNYMVPVSPGDVLDATAVCNIAGSASERLIIPGMAGTEPSGPQEGSVTYQGASVYSLLWPFHAFFMITGFLLLLSAVIIARAGKKTGNWFKKHRILAATGVSLVVIAYIIAFSMLALSGSGHLRFPHSYTGIVILLLAVITLALGIFRNSTKAYRVQVRTVHIWLGRLLLFLMALNIILGLLLTGIL